MKLAADDVLELGGQASARLLREVLIEAGPIDDEVEIAIDRAIGDRGPTSFAELAKRIWEQPAWLAECDRQPGLLTRVRCAAVDGVHEAITSLIVQQVVARNETGNLIVIAEGRVWIADLVFPPLMFALEMNLYGCGPGWDRDGDVEHLVADPRGPAGTFLHWVTSISGGDMRRAFICSARWPGGFPAWGIPLEAPRVRALVSAIRQTPPKYPYHVSEKPSLLGYLLAPGIPTSWEIVDGTRSPDERPGTIFTFTQSATLMALREDPLGAMPSLLARTGQREPYRALSHLLRAAAAYALCRGEAIGGGMLRAPLHAGGAALADVIGFLAGRQLVIQADSVAALVTWLGLAPVRYRPGAGARSWDYNSLGMCGWRELEVLGAVTPVLVDQKPTRWLAFPSGGYPRDLASADLSLSPAPILAAGKVPMELSYPWEGVET